MHNNKETLKGLLVGYGVLISALFRAAGVGSAVLPAAIKNPLTFGGYYGTLKVFFFVFALAWFQPCRGVFYGLVSSHFFLLLPASAARLPLIRP